MTRARRRPLLLTIGLAVALVVAIILSAMIGQVAVSPTGVIGSLLRAAHIATPWASSDPLTEATLWIVRFPRITLAILVGAALAVAGAIMQAIFGNPLADPGLVGVSSGAAVGAAIAIVIGVLGSGATGAFAFVGGLAATLLVYAVSRSGGRTQVVTLILTGVAVNAVAGAALASLLFFANTASREQIVFWQLGSLNGTLWSEVAVAAPVVIVGCVVAVVLARRYDLLALGERSARHLGVNVEALRLGSIVLVALLTGAAVAFCGIIAFVGLVAPHAVRMLIGPRHRPLLVASSLAGALIVVVADLLARTLLTAADLPIGIFTSLVGGPFFFALLLRQRRTGGGWS